MGFNFPAAPTVGQVYPTTPTTGLPQYTWDGTSWVIKGDTSTYLPRAGGTMTGPLILAGNPVAALEAVPRQFAAPIDSLAYNGMQYNGSFAFASERGYNNPNPTPDKYGCDGWQMDKLGTFNPAIASVDPSPVPFPGLQQALVLSINTAKATLAGTDFAVAKHQIEGYRCARLGWGTISAQPLTMCFWTAHGRAGTYTGVARNLAQSRCLAFSYTQNSPGVAEYKTVTIPGCPDGVWEMNVNAGIIIEFSIGCGPSYMMNSFNNWQTGLWHAGPGQVNAVASTSDRSVFAGVIILPGNQGPTYDRAAYIMRPADQEMAIVQRYFEILSGVISHGQCYSATGAILPTFYKEKRALPTIYHPTITNLMIHAAGSGGVSITSLLNIQNLGSKSCLILYNVAGGLGMGDATTLFTAQAGGVVHIDSRL
jgi:hypothetical protein